MMMIGRHGFGGADRMGSHFGNENEHATYVSEFKGMSGAGETYVARPRE